MKLAIVIGLVAVSVLWAGIVWVNVADWWHMRRWRRTYARQAVDVLRACESYMADTKEHPNAK